MSRGYRPNRSRPSLYRRRELLPLQNRGRRLASLYPSRGRRNRGNRCREQELSICNSSF
jgi:hypothetical protein